MPRPPGPRPLGPWPRHPIAVPVDLTALGTSSRWSHTVFVLRPDHALSVCPPIHPPVGAGPLRTWACKYGARFKKIRMTLGAESSLSHTGPRLGPWRGVSRGETEAQWAVTWRWGVRALAFPSLRLAVLGPGDRLRGRLKEGHCGGQEMLGGRDVGQHSAHPYRASLPSRAPQTF